MADVRPFPGVTYDPGRVDLASVLCPPYDVIAPAQQAAYVARDPHNAVNIVLNPAPGGERYTAAATALRSWLDDGVLRQADRAAFYVHRHTFDNPSGERSTARVSRTGLIASVRLEPWETRAVRPHEHTMPGPKQDRLELMRATHADTEPIWVFRPDPGGELRSLLDPVVGRQPLLRTEFQPEPGAAELPPAESHELWEVSDPAEVAAISAAAAAQPLYIADGHHRYETALFHAEESGGPEDAPTRFKVMLLSAAEDPGLPVLPTHRMVRPGPGHSIESAISQLQVRGWTVEEATGMEELLSMLAAPPATNRVGFGLFDGGRCTYLEGIAGLDVRHLPRPLAALDVGMVHEGILRPLLGIGPEELAAGEAVAYARDPREVVARVTAGSSISGSSCAPDAGADRGGCRCRARTCPRNRRTSGPSLLGPGHGAALIIALLEPGERLDPGA